MAASTNALQIDPAWTDRHEVIATFRRFLLSLDARAWEHVAQSLDEHVVIDTTELFPGEVKPEPRDAIVGALRNSLSGFRSMQHALANEIVDIQGDEATLEAYTLERFELATPHGASFWSMGGRYTVQFRRRSRGWQLTALRQRVIWADGNRELLRQAITYTQGLTRDRPP
jgi:hypothetical protein